MQNPRPRSTRSRATKLNRRHHAAWRDESAVTGGLSLFQQIVGLRAGIITPNGRQSTATLKDPVIDGLPVGMSISGRVISNNSYHGDLSDYDFRGYTLAVKTYMGSIVDNLFGETVATGVSAYVDVWANGDVQEFAYNTISGPATFGGAGVAIKIRTSGSGLTLTAGRIRRVRFNRATGLSSDWFKPVGDPQIGGQIVEWNYVRGPQNLPDFPVSYNAGSTYDTGDLVLNNAGNVFSCIADDTTGQAPPTSKVSNSYWDVIDPHGDAVCIVAAIGNGVSIRHNLFDWTDDSDETLGYGPIPASGINNVFRIDRNQGSTALVGLVVFEENVSMVNSASDAYPMHVAARNLPNLNGPVIVRSNWLSHVSNGAYYYPQDGVFDVWSGNVDALSGAVVAAPNLRPVWVSDPYLSGTLVEGQTITAHPSTWDKTVTHTMQISRNGVPISGATGSATFGYTLTYADVGTETRLTVADTVTYGGMSPVVLTSAQVGGVGAAAVLPVCSISPVIAGVAQVGESLSWDNGTWSGTLPITFAGQLYADGEPIAGATASPYTLTSDDIGKVLTVGITATNAAGSHTEMSAPSEVVTDPADYWAVAGEGQSLMTYAFSPEAAFNPPGRLRPTITGSIGRFIMTTRDGTPTISLGDGIVDIEATDANFQSASGGLILPRGAMAVLDFMKFLQPTKIPILMIRATSGTSMVNEMSDTSGGEGTDRRQQNTAAFYGYARTAYGVYPVAVCQAWFGSEGPAYDSDNYTQARALLWFGETAAGLPHVQGANNPDFPSGGGSVSVDHYRFDVSAGLGQIGRGTLPYGTKIGFAVHPNDSIGVACRASIGAFLDDPRISGMSFPWHPIPMSGHISETTDDGQPMVALQIMGPVILNALGLGYTNPTLIGYEVAADRSYADFIVNLPNGGTLGTTRAQRGIPDPVSPTASYMPIYGGEVQRPSHTERRLLTRLGSSGDASTRGTLVIVDTGSGTVPTRTAKVRWTPEVLIDNGTLWTYRQGDVPWGQTVSSVTYDQDPDQLELHILNHLVEIIPALQRPGAGFQFPGLEVMPMAAPFAIETTPPPAAVGDPVLLLAHTESNTVTSITTGQFTIPSGNGVLLAFTAYNSALSTGDEGVTSSGITAVSGGAVTAMPAQVPLNTRSGAAVELAFAVQNPAAGAHTFNLSLSNNSREARVSIVWVPNAVLPVAAADNQGTGGSNTSITFARTPTATTALSIYAAARNDASAAAISVSGATLLDEGNGGTTSASNTVESIVAWAKHGSVAAQSVTMSWTGSKARVGAYVELVGS